MRSTSPASINSRSGGHNSINMTGGGGGGGGGNPTTASSGNYYYSAQNPMYGKHVKVNVDNVWNPVDTYIYGPTQNSIFAQPDQHQKYGSQKLEKFANLIGGGGGGGGGSKETTGHKGGGGEKIGYTTTTTTTTSADMSGGRSGGAAGNSAAKKSQKFNANSRRLISELYDNETPRLCDHNFLEQNGNRMRPCSPLESYVSSARDMVISYYGGK